MKELGAKLLSLADVAESRLREVSDAASQTPVLQGGWSRKQVIGHLIDSASNNHQRFVRALIQPELDFPSYDQPECVRVQAFADSEWSSLVTLWVAYNRHLAHVIAHFPASKLGTPCRISANPAVTLGELAEGYVSHVLHHLEQIGADRRA